MAVAVPQDHTRTGDGKARLRILLGVEFAENDRVLGDIGKEGDIMAALHGMRQGDKVICLDDLHLDFMAGSSRLRLQHRQQNAAAAEGSLPHGMNDVSADRAR